MANVAQGGSRPSTHGNENRTESTAEHVGEQAREKGESAMQSLQQMGANIKESAQENLTAVRDRAAEMMERGRSKAMDMERTLESRVRENPMAALGIAIGAGFLLGACLVRRN